MKRHSGNGQRGFTISELLLVFTAVALMVIVLVPTIRMINNNRDKTICINNLQQIGLALYIYAREHEGKFPAGLKTLYEEEYLADEQLMDCPATKEKGTVDNPDYIYVGGLSIAVPSKNPIVKDKNGNHSGGKNILELDGDVVWVKE